MISKAPRLRINKLVFMNRDDGSASLGFPAPLSFVYGASNTGKSFAVKAIDFMMGGGRELPNIVERHPYSRVHLHLAVDDTPIVLDRFIGGGDFLLKLDDGSERVLSARHSAENDTNLSNYLLRSLDIEGRELARDKSGTKKPLSFRDIVRFCITDETAIQSETSPVESGDKILQQVERNAFKYLLTGVDDSALITQEKPQEFRTGKSAQLRFITEMLAQIEIEIAEDFPDIDQLDELQESVEDELNAVELDIVAARGSVRAALERKRLLTNQLNSDQQRVSDIAITLENFDQLQRVYTSDIARLEALEEAGFLFGMDANKACPVCGAPPEAQVHDHGLVEIDKARAAAEAEIAKIRLHQSELQRTTEATQAELVAAGERLLENREQLATVEAELRTASPNADDQQRRFAEIIPKRDRINRGLALLQRREDLERQQKKVESAKQVRPKTNFQPGLSFQTAQEFADEVSNVLTAWGFPGDKRVQFDMQSHDLVIGGKHRKDNGKGVRAITHAAFKVAMLTFCRGRTLPHPGFVVLDTPLITYRDPIRSPLGALTADEQAITQSNLKEAFFKHLAGLGGLGQVILFDNADPPPGADAYAYIETFTNDPDQGRQGLFTVPRPTVEEDLIG